MDGDVDGRDDSLVPTLGHVFDLSVEIDEPIEIGDTGDGFRRIVPITGGTVSGEVTGDVLPHGADFQLLRLDRPTELVAKYAFETDSGARVYVQNRGLAVAPREVNGRVKEGLPVDPSKVYFRTVPTFETADDDLAWLTERVFVATAEPKAGVVDISVYEVE